VSTAEGVRTAVAFPPHRREAIVERWRVALGRTGFVPLGPSEVRSRLASLVDQLVATVDAERLDRPAARSVGTQLA
jgi:hypothetical protein